MTGKYLLILFVICILLHNCKTPVSDKQVKLESTSLVNKIDSTSNELTIKTNNDSLTDTTNYLSACFYKILINGEQSFKDIEKLLLEKNILKNANPRGYKVFFITYVLPLQFGFFNNRNTSQVDKQFFQNKLQIANILRTHIKLNDGAFDTLEDCGNVQSKKKNFEKSNIKALIDKITEITDQLIAGTLDVKYKNDTYNVLNKDFSSKLFNNTDSRVISYYQLSKSLNEYDEERMDDEYSKTLESLKQFKKSNGK